MAGSSVSVETGTVNGPASYSTGGFTVTTGLSTVNFFAVNINTATAALPECVFDYILNSPSAGQVKVVIFRTTVDEASGNTDVDPTGLPSGVTSSALNNQSYDADGAHVHTINHDHAVQASTAATDAGAGVSLAAGGDNISTHTHNFNPPNFTGNSGAGDSHTHQWNNIYQHAHDLNPIVQGVAATQLAAATDISGAVFSYVAMK